MTPLPLPASPDRVDQVILTIVPDLDDDIEPAPRELLASFFVQREAWMDYAACRGLDPNLFFPQRGDSTREAKAVCHTCVVGSSCDDYADRTGSQYGVWNGATRSRTRTR